MHHFAAQCILTLKKDQNRSHISLQLRSFQAVCDRCFIGRSAVVVDVLSMIQCCTSDGGERQRDRERDVFAWMFGGGGDFQYIIHRVV